MTLAHARRRQWSYIWLSVRRDSAAPSQAGEYGRREAEETCQSNWDQKFASPIEACDHGDRDREGRQTTEGLASLQAQTPPAEGLLREAIPACFGDLIANLCERTTVKLAKTVYLQVLWPAFLAGYGGANRMGRSCNRDRAAQPGTQFSPDPTLASQLSKTASLGARSGVVGQ